MHDVEPAIILLNLYLFGFASLTTGLFLFKSGIQWGGRLGASGVPMSRRSRMLFTLTVWMLSLLVITGTLQYSVSGVFGLGFFVCFPATMISGMIDAYRVRRAPARRPEDDAPSGRTDPS